MNSKPKLTVVTLNFNNYKMTIECVESVLKNDLKDLQIIVVDNASFNNEFELLKKHFEKNKLVRVVETGSNLGFAGGMNYGVRLTETRFVVLLNNDTIVHKNWAKIMLDAFEKKDVAVAGPRAYYPNEDPNKEHNRGALNVLFRHVLNPPEKNPPFFFVEGASPFIDLKKIPLPFDDDYFIYHEDLYLCLKARLYGFDTVHEPRARLMHLGSQTSRKMKSKIAFYHERNRVWNMLLFYEKKTLLKLLPAIVLDELLSVVKNVFVNQSYVLPQLKAIASIFGGWKKIMEKRREIQRNRQIRDSELLKYLYASLFPYNNLIAKILNAPFYWYLRLVGIKTRECYL